MALTSEIAKLKRAVDELIAGAEVDLRSKSGIAPAQRPALRAEIEGCIQALDELRAKLS
jgi:hypothetical protein